MTRYLTNSNSNKDTCVPASSMITSWWAATRVQQFSSDSAKGRNRELCVSTSLLLLQASQIIRKGLFRSRSNSPEARHKICGRDWKPKIELLSVKKFFPLFLFIFFGYFTWTCPIWFLQKIGNKFMFLNLRNEFQELSDAFFSVAVIIHYGIKRMEVGGRG